MCVLQRLDQISAGTDVGCALLASCFSLSVTCVKVHFEDAASSEGLLSLLPIVGLYMLYFPWTSVSRGNANE